jgi:hypothetical protein
MSALSHCQVGDKWKELTRGMVQFCSLPHCQHVTGSSKNFRKYLYIYHAVYKLCPSSRKSLNAMWACEMWFVLSVGGRDLSSVELQEKYGLWVFERGGVFGCKDRGGAGV